MDIALAVAQVLLGAAIGESACEFLVAPLFDWLVARLKFDPDLKGILLRTVSATVGVLIAVEYALNIPGLLGMQALHPWLGQALTGLVIGRGSNAVHEFLAKVGFGKVLAQARAMMAVSEYKAARRADEQAERAAERYSDQPPRAAQTR
jgi:hypothetical protein